MKFVDEVKIVATIEPGTVDVEDTAPSGRAARASRREKRAAEAEMKQVLEEMHKAIEESGLPPLPAPGELPPTGDLPPLPAPPPGGGHVHAIMMPVPVSYTHLRAHETDS